MNVWYVSCKMKEVFLGKKTISNQRLLDQSDKVLYMFGVNFIEAVMKMEEKCNWPQFKYTYKNLLLLCYSSILNF
jgi:hypothetical protein